MGDSDSQGVKKGTAKCIICFSDIAVCVYMHHICVKIRHMLIIVTEQTEGEMSSLH